MGARVARRRHPIRKGRWELKRVCQWHLLLWGPWKLLVLVLQQLLLLLLLLEQDKLKLQLTLKVCTQVGGEGWRDGRGWCGKKGR